MPSIPMTNEIVKIVRTEDDQYSWTRQARNGRVTHMADKPYKQKHSAIVAAVRENPDVYRENFRDATSGKMQPLKSAVLNRRPSKHDQDSEPKE